MSSGGRGPFAPIVADFNRDGIQDLAVSNAGSDAVALFLATGPGRFAPPRAFPVGRVARGMAAADLNADGAVDLVVASAQSRELSIMLGDGRGEFQRSQRTAGIAPFTVEVTDLDGDGHLDIAVANESNTSRFPGEVSVLFGDGTGRFPRGSALVAGLYPSDVKAGDLNGDGVTDLAAVNWGSTDVSLFMGRGGGEFAAAVSVPYGGVSAYSLAIADLNGDRSPDIVTGDVSGKVVILRNQGDGRFALADPLAAQTGLRCVVVADLNADTVLDLVTANTGAGTVSLFLGERGGGFAPPEHIPVGTHPRTVIAADVDGDGRLDLVVTNGMSNDVSLLINAGNVSP